MQNELNDLFFTLNPDFLKSLKEHCIYKSSNTLESVINKFAAKHENDKTVLDEIKELKEDNSISCRLDYYKIIDYMIVDLETKYRIKVNMKFGIDDTFDAEYSGIIHETKAAANVELKEAEHKLKNDDLVIYCYIEEI